MKNALMVWGGWDGHTPKQATELLAPLLEARGFVVEISDTLDAYLDEASLHRRDLVVQCVTMANITGEQSQGLQKAVKAGVGFAGWHGGIIDSFRNDTGYQWMTGGQWVAHPGGCIPSYTVNITDPDHAITKGIADFELTNTEQYYLHCDPGIHVLCSTTFSGEYDDPTLYPAGTVMPYAWTRQYGAGRVFVAAWGHTYKDFETDSAREIMLRGMN
ncbi:MAG: ThuA domain-containing protein, partial [Verrucomicrobia bacterium]|nr:ThuA domain-containing protein [Verrucomicrobiota bacterium]